MKNGAIALTVLLSIFFGVSCGDGGSAGTPGEMVEVPAGTFQMGCNSAVDTECKPHESPYHAVTLSAYKIGKYEVTVGEYQKCVDDGACNNNGAEEHYISHVDSEDRCNFGMSDRTDHPINCVTWFGAKAFCEWAGGRLPTEAEWEKAARGTDGRKYPWGNEERSCDYAMISACGVEATIAVGSKEAGVSPYGAYDMVGNVWEWVEDWYSESYYGTSPAKDPTGPEAGTYRVLRGGSWAADDPSDARVSSRFYYDFDGYYNKPSYGFRCAK